MWLKLSSFIFACAFSSIGSISYVKATPEEVKACVKIQTAGLGTDEGILGIRPSEAQQIILKIAGRVGLRSADISVIQCESLDDAEAYYSDGKTPSVPQGEYIVYNPIWLKAVAGTDPTQAYGIFGHEFGHLIARHSFKPHMSSHDKELEADGFAGCAVAKMKGDWKSLESLLMRLRPDIISTYPSGKESVEAARQQFVECGGKLTEVATTGQETGLDPDTSHMSNGWIYLGHYDDANRTWTEGRLRDVGSSPPEKLVGNQFFLNRIVNVRDGPFRTPAGTCDYTESKTIGSIKSDLPVEIKEIYRLEGGCESFIWARVEYQAPVAAAE